MNQTNANKRANAKVACSWAQPSWKKRPYQLCCLSDFNLEIFFGTTYLLLLNYYYVVLLQTALFITDIYFVFTVHLFRVDSVGEQITGIFLQQQSR